MDSENCQKRVQVSVTELPEKHVSLSSYLQLPSFDVKISLCVKRNGKRRRGYPCRTHSFLRPWTEEMKNPSTEVPRGRTHLAVCAEARLQARLESAQALFTVCIPSVPAPARWSCHARAGSSACSVSLEKVETGADANLFGRCSSWYG